MTTQELLARARQARGAMALADTQTKDRALLAMAEELEADTAAILAANALDLEGARGRISEVMLDRLALSPDRIAGMAEGDPGGGGPALTRWGLSSAGWSGPTGW